MNTVKKGTKFENEIYDFLIKEINNNNFPIKPECCKIFKQKKYYSKDREGFISFDIAIEMYFPNATEYSMLFLIECKDYNHPVPVDDIEEFFTKTQQVAASNSKAILTARSSFQKGARNFAKSKGMGLLRYIDSNSMEWILRRIASHTAIARQIKTIESALDQHDVAYLDARAYIQTPLGFSHDIFDIFIESFMQEESSSDFLMLLRDTGSREVKNKVPYLGKNKIEILTQKILEKVNYQYGEVALDKIYEIENRNNKLNIFHHHSEEKNLTVLGEFLFKKKEIHLYFNNETPEEQKKFSFAHELGHYFLNHGKYIDKEKLHINSCDFLLYNKNDFSDLARLEYQANYFAACLLMPEKYFKQYFYFLLDKYKIKNRGFAYLYLDEQPCNTENYLSITLELMNHFKVSRTAISNRLEGFGLLVRKNDTRITIDKPFIRL